MSNIFIISLCIFSVGQVAIEGGRRPKDIQRFYLDRGQDKIKLCTDIATRAKDKNIDPLEVIALSFIETRHTNNLTSKAGAKGALQALPKYWSRKGDKDYIDAGLRAWMYYRSKTKSLRHTAGRYNGAGSRSYYAKKYMRHYEKLKKIKRTLNAGVRL
jgi:hypothetical protein